MILEKDIVNHYINSLLDKDYYGSDFCCSDRVNIEDVYNAICSSKFRKTRITEETQNDIERKLSICLQNKQPLKFCVPFGAYKAWKLDLGFRPDWAEVFNLSYVLKYAISLCKVYPFGIDITYTFSDEIMYFVSDIPQQAAKQYVEDFENLIGLFNSLFSKVSFHLVRINELYHNIGDYYIDFLKNFLDNLVFWEDKYDDNTKARHIKSAHNNVFMFGERNIAAQPEEIQEKYFFYSALMTDAVDCLKERRKYNKDTDKIQLVGVKGPSKSINMGACETSTVHFWTGCGVLKKNNGILKPYVLTYKNMIEAKEKTICKRISINSPFGKISNNYKTITIMEE